MDLSFKNILILALVVFGLWAVFVKPPTVTIRDIRVPVSLTPHQLDSMHLAIREQVKGELKPVIKKEYIDKTDTATIKRQINEIIALKDSLHGKAEMNLEFHGFVGPTRDTLDVKADFVSDSISVVFRPKQRDFEVIHRDTLETYRGFLDRFAFGPGVSATIGGGVVSVNPSLSLIYIIFP